MKTKIISFLYITLLILLMFIPNAVATEATMEGNNWTNIDGITDSSGVQYIRNTSNIIITLQNNDTLDRQFVNDTFVKINTYLGNFPNLTVMAVQNFLNATFLPISTYSGNFPNATVQFLQSFVNNTFVRIDTHNGDFPNSSLTSENYAAWNATYNTTYEGYRIPIAQLQQNDTDDRDFVNATFLKINTYLTNFPNDTVMTIQTFLNATFLRTDTYNGNFPNATITSGTLSDWNNTYNTTYEGYRSQIFVLQQNDSQDEAYVNATFIKIIDFNSTINVSIDRILSNYSNNLGWINNTTIDRNLANYTNTPGFITSTYNVTYDQTTLTVNGNLGNWNNTYNTTYDATTLTVNGNLLNWNATYNASYLRIDTYNGDFPNSTVSLFSASISQLQQNDTTDRQYVNDTFVKISDINLTINTSVDRNLANFTNSLGWVNNTTVNTYNQTYQEAYTTIQNNTLAWNATYNSTYDSYNVSISQLQLNDTTDRDFVNATFVKILTYAGNFPNLTVIILQDFVNNTFVKIDTYSGNFPNLTIPSLQYLLNNSGFISNVTLDRNLANYTNIYSWVNNTTVDRTYSNLVGIPTDYPNLTVLQNSDTWNSTYNSSYLTNITSDKNLSNFTNSQNWINNASMDRAYDNLTNIPIDFYNSTVANNTANWNNTYNASYLRIDTYNENFPNSTVPSLQYLVNNSGFVSNLTIDRDLNNYTNSLNWVNNTTSTKFNATYQNNTFTLLTYFNDFMTTFNQTYQDAYIIIQNNLLAWNATYNTTYEGYRDQISILQSNDTTDRQYVNDTFVKIGTNSGDFPNSTVANNTINWNNTYNSTYNVLLTNAPNTTITAENLIAWNATYNISYLTNITLDKNLSNYTNTPEFVTNITMFNSTFNQTYQDTHITQQNNLLAWNATYNATYLRNDGGYVTNTTVDRKLSNFTNDLVWITNTTSDKDLKNFTNTYKWVNNSTVDKSYSNLVGIPTNFANSTVQNNLDNWNATYNATYDSLINNLSDVGLVLDMKFDENSTGIATSTKIHDSSKYSNDGTWNGNVNPNYTSSKYGTALSFDGVNDRVNAGNDASLNLQNNFTLSAWVKKNNTNQLSFFGKGGGALVQYSWTIRASDTIFYIQGGLYVTSSDTPNVNTWSMVSLTFVDGIVIFYKDGVSMGTGNISGIIQSAPTQPVYLGFTPMTGSYFNGSIDEVRIYNRALSASEIKSLFYSNPLSDKSSFIQSDNFRIINNTGYNIISISNIGDITTVGTVDGVDISGNLDNWNATYNASYDSKEPSITGSTSNVFWNGLKQWISLTYLNITGFNSTVQNIIDIGGYVTNTTMDRALSNFNNNVGFISNITMDRSLSNFANSYSWVNNSTMDHNYNNLTNLPILLTNISMDKNLSNYTNSQNWVNNISFDKKLSNFTNDLNWINNTTVDRTYSNLVGIPTDFANATVQNNLVTWNATYNTTYEGFRTSKEDTITGSTNNVFWNGLKQWISLTYLNITGFNSTVQNIIDIGGYVTNVTSTKFNATYQNNTITLSTYFAAFMSTFNQTYQDTYVTQQNNLVAWNSTYNASYVRTDSGYITNISMDRNYSNMTNTPIITTESFTAAGEQNFTVINTLKINSSRVYVNGVKQIITLSYTENIATKSVNFTWIPRNGDIVAVEYTY